MQFLRKVQNSPKVKAIRKKIKDQERKRKQLSREYKSALKSESRKLGKKKPKGKRKTRSRR